MYMVDNNTKKSGFALLVSLIVVSAVLSVGLVILDLTIKQVALAVTTKESEIAFHAANAGMECARYWRRQLGTDIEAGADIGGSLVCFGSSVNSYLRANNGITDAVSHTYRYEFTWGPANDRCTRVDMISLVPSTPSSVTILSTDMRSLLPGYPDQDLNCIAGSQCTVISLRGYNRGCPAPGNDFGVGVVERKVLLEF